MKLVSANSRVALGLISLSFSAWMTSYSMGLLPDIHKPKVDGRIAVAENVALNCSLLASRNDLRTIEASLKAMVERNPEVLSAGIRRPDGTLLFSVGEHANHWNLPPDGNSTESEMRVPILAGNSEWGTVELRFEEELIKPGLFGMHPYVGASIFTAAAMYLLFFLYLRKMLKHLDPTKVIPRRVRETLDTMAEGLLVLDKDERILLANKAFSEALGKSPDELTGQKVTDLPFEFDEAQLAVEGFPWERAMREGEPQVGDILKLRVGPQKHRVLKVSATPVYGDDGKQRGALASFDDVTQLRERQVQLHKMLETLSQSREEIQKQNQELERLATCDPLTGCLNRRAFFKEFERCWSASERHGYPMSCIMVDLDHFKRINDDHGHQKGDMVLQKASEVLRQDRRPTDVVCRYGGEEFSVLLPHTDVENACIVAERIRAAIEATDFDGLKVTSSIGVSAISFGAKDPNELLDQADKCLYVAKRGGRNQVVRYDKAADEIAAFVASGQKDVGRGEPKPESKDEPSIPFQAVSALISALEFRDHVTAAHSRRVSDYCATVGRKILSLGDVYLLEIAALLHDIGKIGVPDSILLKPGKLTEDEWQVMSSQERIGQELINSTFANAQLNETLRCYRAWFGGQEIHPELPKGDDIPIASRILAICDAYDSMTSPRTYRVPFTPDEAFEELRRCAGTQFDPELVERFIEKIAEEERRSKPRIGAVCPIAAMGLGPQIERLVVALDNRDLHGIATLASRVYNTANRHNVTEVASKASLLEKAVRDSEDVDRLLELTNDLVDFCRSAQKAYLENSTGLAALAVLTSSTQLESAGATQDV